VFSLKTTPEKLKTSWKRIKEAEAETKPLTKTPTYSFFELIKRNLT